MAFELFVQSAWMIPAAADLSGIPVEKVQKIWDAAQKKEKLCILTVPGDLPPMKKCPICELNYRQDATVCNTPKCGHIWED